jgi:hypothetical protein
MRASDFLASIGVCTHIVQAKDDPAKVGPALTYAGFRNVREDATHNTSIIASLVGIHAATGAMIVELPIVDSDPNNVANSLPE